MLRLSIPVFVSLLALSFFSIVSCGWAADRYPAISTADLKNLSEKNEPFFLIDARTRLEYEESHIQGAVNIAPPYVEASHCLLPEAKNVRIVVYCDDVDCAEHVAVAKNLTALGYAKVSLYREGLAAWESAGLPVRMGVALNPAAQAEKIALASLMDIVISGSGTHTVIDVREPHEYHRGHIPGAINLPVGSFQTRAELLPPDKPLVVYCNTQKRSFIAYRKLVELGFQKIFFFSFFEWQEADGPVVKTFTEGISTR